MSALEAASAGVKDMADGSLRITIEFEPRHAKEAFALFGARGTPLAVVALAVGYAAAGAPVISKTATTEKPKGGALAKLSGIWCNDPEFYTWIRPAYDILMGGTGKNFGDVTPNDDFGGDIAAYCKHCILVFCEIQSRAELDHDEIASEKFHRLIRGPYAKYLAARGRA